MSEDKELKQWKEKLFYQPKNGYDRIDAEQAGEIFAYAEGYKQFLDAARTEREAVKEAIRMAEAEGFVPYTFGMELQPLEGCMSTTAVAAARRSCWPCSGSSRLTTAA